MEEVEKDVQKKVVAFCIALPLHIELWQDVLKEVQHPVTVLGNFAEQLQCIERANMKYIMDDFSYVQEQLQTKILVDIEEELKTIKIQTEKLSKSNHDIKNKLSTLERATLDLDWGSESALVKGTATQPRLDKLLQMGYDVWITFSEASKRINNQLKTLRIRDQRSVREFQKSFSDIKLGQQQILALTQYVINANAIT